MGNLINNIQQQSKTDKGNRLYEFQRVPTQELLDCRIPAYSYLA